jgi:hypothetical protein
MITIEMSAAAVFSKACFPPACLAFKSGHT